MLDLSFRPEDCMEEFVLKYENRLYRTAIAIIGNKADAEEIAVSYTHLDVYKRQVKGRIKNVLNYKKPSFWIILFSIIIVAAIGIGLAANPKSSASFNGSSYRVKEILYQAPMYSFSYILDTCLLYTSRCV